ncbi:MAG: MarR family winged helix-turn-helix transcriptional regulator [Eggerthellaceae bacterium]
MSKQMSKKMEQAQHLEDLQDSMIIEYSKMFPKEYFAPALMLSRTILKNMAIYEQFAKQFGLTYNALMVLISIRFTQYEVSQSTISKLLWLPKQTVGSILNSLKKKGYITEAVSSGDARSKVILFTDEGKSFVDPIFDQLQSLDLEAIQSVSSEQLEAAVQSMKDYTEAFENAFIRMTS